MAPPCRVYELLLGLLLVVEARLFILCCVVSMENTCVYFHIYAVTVLYRLNTTLTKVLRIYIVFVFLQYDCLTLVFVFAFHQLKTTMAVGLRIPIRLVSTMEWTDQQRGGRKSVSG